ncbi:MAG: 3-ketosteroid-9-alpha-hydroxylase, partial [Comamonadaceae bacterium]|nr:3-ketosteroid-9-alpha-hydroxylase [Comamonadaceae bacterium]
MTTPASRYHALTVQAVVEETPDTKSLVFAIPPALQQAFHYKPGQFLTLRLPVGGRWLPRCYSMSSAPGMDESPRVTIKRVQDGRGSNWVCDKVRVGDSIEVMAPA